MADFICSALAREHNTQIIGSAQTVKVWLLVEYRRVYGAQAVEDFWRDEFAGLNHTPLSAFPDSRTQMIKRREASSADGFTAFVVIADEQRPRMYDLRFKTYPDLLTLDLAALVNDDSAYDRQRRIDPLFIVCTNGRRDPCCARYGTALHAEMLKWGGEAVWESSHITGHRFAATLVAFPFGLYYGQVEPEEAQKIVEMTRNRQVYYEKLRGRSFYTREGQVAEYFLRKVTGERALTAFSLKELLDEGGGIWTARFAAEKEQHLVRFSISDSEWETFTSCDATAPKRDAVFALLGHEML